MSLKRRKPLPTPALPPSHLEAIRAAGFDVIGWQHVAVRVRCADGEERNEWLPRDLVHWEKRLFISYGIHAGYPDPGWSPTDGRHWGGHHDTVTSALAWFGWLEAQKAR